MKKKSIILFLALCLALGGCQKKDEGPTRVETGMSEIENQYYDKALENFQAALSEDDEDEKLMAYRGAGMAYMGLGQYDMAAASFEEALKRTTDKMPDTKKDILYYKATAQYKMGDYEAAAASCNEILGIKGEADAYYLRGASYLANQEKDKAKIDFDAAAALAPKDYDLFLNIYMCYEEQKLSANGDEYLQKALAIQGTETKDYYNRGRIYYYLEDYEAAQRELVKPVEEKDAASLLLMGKVYMALSDTAHSKVMYQQYIDAYGETPEAYNGLALAEMSDGNYDAALADIAKGLGLDEEKGKQELYFNEIVAYENKKDFSTAKVKAEAYVQMYPGDEQGKKEYDFLSTR